MKKILSILLCFALLLSTAALLPVAVSAEVTSGPANPPGTAQWSYDSDTETLTISGTGAVECKSNVPPFVKWWQGQTGTIRHAVVEEGIQYFGYCLFYGMSDLETVELPATLEYTGISTFAGCNSLSSITVSPDSRFFTEVDGSIYSKDMTEFIMTTPTFSGTLTIPGTVASITGESSFSRYIDTLVLNEGTSLIDYGAFGNCSLLETVYLPASLTAVNNGAFYNSSLLTDVYFAGTKAEWNLVTIAVNNDPLTSATIHCSDGIYENNITWSFDDATATLTISGTGDMFDYLHTYERTVPAPWASVLPDTRYVVIEEGITSIGKESFYEAGAIESVSLPSTLTKIGENAFFRCSNLADVNIPGSVTYIDRSAFAACSSLDEIDIPYGVEYIGVAAFSSCSSLTEITIPGSVETLDGSAFSSCSSLATVIIEDGVKNIGAYAFYGDPIVTLEIPDSLEEFGENSIKDNQNLTFVEYDNAKYYGNTENPYIILISARDTEITECTIHPDTRVILPAAFAECASLTGIVIPDGIKVIPRGAFSRCSSLEYADIPESVDVIRFDAFIGCGALLSADLPATMTMIEGQAFEGAGIETLVIPEGIESFGLSEFFACWNLRSIHFPSTFKSFDYYTSFGNLKSLETITIDPANPVFHVENNCLIETATGNLVLGASSGNLPDGITRIECSAFNGRENLTSVQIPGTVTEIGPYAFLSCKNITEIVVPEGVVSIDSEAFDDCDNLRSFSIPSTATEIGIYFVNSSNLDSFSVSADNPRYKYINNCLIDTQENNLIFGLDGAVIPTDMSIETIALSAFYGHCLPETVIVPEGVRSLGSNSFDETTGVKYVYLPSTLKTVEPFALQGEITDIYYPGSEAEWKQNVSVQISIIYNGVVYGGIGPEVKIHYNATYTGCEHDYVLNVETAPTCTANGREVYTCSNCGEYYVISRRIDHDFSEYVYTLQPTQEHDGLKHRTCSMCGTEESVVVKYMIGDTDGDGALDMKDIRYLKQYFSGSKGDANVPYLNCDINGDGDVDLKDVAALKKLIAG